MSDQTPEVLTGTLEPLSLPGAQAAMFDSPLALLELPIEEVRIRALALAKAGGGAMRQLRRYFGGYTWAMRRRLPDGEFGLWLKDFAEVAGVRPNTLREWADDVEKAEKLPALPGKRPGRPVAEGSQNRRSANRLTENVNPRGAAKRAAKVIDTMLAGPLPDEQPGPANLRADALRVSAARAEPTLTEGIAAHRLDEPLPPAQPAANEEAWRAARGVVHSSEPSEAIIRRIRDEDADDHLRAESLDLPGSLSDAGMLVRRLVSMLQWLSQPLFDKLLEAVLAERRRRRGLRQPATANGAGDHEHAWVNKGYLTICSTCGEPRQR